MSEKEAIDVQAEPLEALPVNTGPMTPNALARRYTMIRELMNKHVLVEGVDYGTIPNAGDKKVLMKSGAEKLAAFFGLTVELELLDKVEQWDPPAFFYYRYKARVTMPDGRIAEGEGSANSREKKYRYRYLKEREYDSNIHGPAVEIEKTGRYGPYKVYQVENPEPYDLVNTIQKMAQKRAYVAGVLLAVGASAFFTQDLEDIEDEPVTPEAGAGRGRRGPAGKAPKQAQKVTEALARKVQEKLESIGFMFPPGADDEDYRPFLAWLVGREEAVEITELTVEEANVALNRILKEKAALIDDYFGGGNDE